MRARDNSWIFGILALALALLIFPVAAFGEPLNISISSITSTTADGFYNAGESINVRVTFSEAVTLAGGTLDVTLDTAKVVSISAFGPSTTADGTYTIGAGDTSADLDSTGITLNGGTIKDAANNDVIVALPATTIADGSAIIVDTTAPVISSTSPATNVHIKAGFTVGYTLSEAVASGIIKFTSTAGSDIGTTYTYALAVGDLTSGAHSIVEGSLTGISLVDGSTYTVTFDATDAATNAATTVTNTGVVYDTTAPTITDYGPEYSIPADYTTLYVSTDEMASCVYNSSNSTPISLSTSNGLNHQVLLQGLSEGMHYYTVMCTDIYGNRMAEGYSINFSVSIPVSADVDFSSPSPLKAGLYQITLITSRSVIPTPQLNYNIGGTSGSIELVGSGSTWKGYLIIPPDAGDKVGSFSFSGTDYYGQTGNLITSGKLFLVDTVPPAQPTISAFSNPDGSIGLMIRYDGEALSEFNIYRAGSAGVTLMDFYTNSSNASSFTDRQVSQGKTYYYAVSAVDQAGNEGSFSNEVSAVSMKSDSNSSQISPEALKSINRAMALAESSIETVSQRISAISSSSDRDAIEATGILQDAGDAKTRLQNIYDSLNALKSSSGDDSDINSEVARQELAIRSIESSVPLDVKVTEYSPTSVQASGEDIASAISKASPQNSGDLNYLKNVNAAQSAISQKVSGKLVSAVYETSTQYFTFINEKITANQQVNDSTLVILIPKSVAEDTSNIDFITAGYSVIQNDPVVSFPYSASSSGQSTTIEYVIKGKASESDLSGIKAVLMENQNGSPSPATGNAVAKTIKSNAKYIGIIIGMLVLGILAAYYFRMGKQRKDAFSSGSKIDSMIDDESGLIGENAREKGFADTAKESRSALESQQESKAYVSQKSIDDVLASLRTMPFEELSEAQRGIVISEIRRLEEIKAEQAGGRSQ